MKKRHPKYERPAKSLFYKDLRKDVTAYLSARASDGRSGKGMILKVIFCVALFILAYTQYINPAYTLRGWLLVCMGMGISSMLVGLNIGHDAIHQALFRRRWLNKLAGLSFDLIGLSSYAWHLKHNIIHHSFPNVTTVDFDIEASPFLRLSPADKHRWFHRYQHLYAPVVYALFSLNLLLVNDVALLIHIRREDIDGKRHPKGISVLVFFSKAIYLGYMLILPVYLLTFPWWQILIGFLFMHAVLSLLLALVLLPSHLFEHTSYSVVDTGGLICEDWVVHQMATTLDYAPNNVFINFMFGGFNTNVVHHLFPRICHYYYKPLTRIVERKAKEHNILYHKTTLAGAIKSHFKALRKLGSPMATAQDFNH